MNYIIDSYRDAEFVEAYLGQKGILMKIFGMGIDYSTRKPLIGQMDEMEFGLKIRDSLSRNAKTISRATEITLPAIRYRGEIERNRTTDLGDPRAAGWTFLIAASDPHKEEIIEAIRPLAEHRRMSDPGRPLLFQGESPDEWGEWILENYTPLETGWIPHYILIVGNPIRVPFHFQSLLNSMASVGRLDFETVDDLRTYVNKVIRLEKAELPATEGKAIFFATAIRPGDATDYSRRYMAEPLANHVRDKLGFGMNKVMGEDATKENLLKSLKGSKAALVYTASHGIGVPNKDLGLQKQFNGAICCQEKEEEDIENWLFTADDIPPKEEPFLEGAVFFEFACFGYGTPAESDYEHWFGSPKLNAKEDFVAALPKRLIAHPKGPLAFIGHTDSAWLHGFDDPNNPENIDRWNPRIVPFKTAVETLLKAQTVGLSMSDMNKRFNLGNALLTNAYDRLQKGRINETPEFWKLLVDTFITRSDAQNYMIFGDPAVRLRIMRM